MVYMKNLFIAIIATFCLGNIVTTFADSLGFQVEVDKRLIDSNAYLQHLSCGAAPLGTGGYKPHALKGDFNFEVTIEIRVAYELECNVWVLNQYGAEMYHYPKQLKLSWTSDFPPRLLYQNFKIKLMPEGYTLEEIKP